MSLFIFRRDGPGVYHVFIRDSNERIGLVIHNPHRHHWDAHWGQGPRDYYLCGNGETRERAAVLIFLKHLSSVSRNAVEAMREMARDWHTYQPLMQTVLMDELQQLRDASANLVAKLEEHIT